MDQKHPVKFLGKQLSMSATQPSAETQIAVANAKKQCKCVQAKEVEVLTTPAV